ncbi:hypothetical protein [Mycoplasmopsis gallinacea]|uniref:Tyr recombinase domain-containing protein n=1 Tax=Mycoplasmopsis gallinacea TaxID=29556 RepID=A0A6H0V2W5_9BACT|nr:hypothetical protein [Mycoplasmopsis gallinacea]QIW62532.1 hypothetical protein GOQ20_03880 [Mycoplasmopsis gallinacea]
MLNTLEQLKTEYLSTIKNKGTQKLYKAILNKVETLNVKELNEFLKDLKDKNTNNYVALSYRVIKQFLRFAEDFEKINLQVSKLEPMKVEKNIKTALNSYQMDLIDEIAKNTRDPRFCFFLAYMRENACRISEAIKSLNDLDNWKTQNGETTQINQASKNGNFRVFRIPSQWVGKWENFIPYKLDTVQKQMKRFSEFLKKEWSNELGGISLKSHDYRTAGITALYTNGVSLEDIALVTGHKSTGVLRNTYVNADKDYMISLLNVANTGAFKNLKEAQANKELKKLKSEKMKLEKASQKNHEQLKKLSESYAKVKTQLINSKEELKELKKEIKELKSYISFILDGYEPEQETNNLLTKLKELNNTFKGVKNV